MKEEEEDGENLTPVYRIPRLHAKFCRMVCTGEGEEELSHVEIYLEGVYKLIHDRLQELQEQEEVSDDEMCVSFELRDVSDSDKEETLQRLSDSGFEIFTAVDTEEEAEYLRDLERLSEFDDLIKEAMSDYETSATRFIIYW